MITFAWYSVDTSFVWASGFVADHRIFHEMATSPERAEEKTMHYLSQVGATRIVVHSVTPESEPKSPLPLKPASPVPQKPEESAPKVRSLF